MITRTHPTRANPCASASGGGAPRACSGAVAFGVLAVVIAQSREGRVLDRVDRAVFAALLARRHPVGSAAARVTSALAEPGSVYPLLAAAAVAGARRASWWRACTPFLVVAGGAAARRILARAIARPRPPATAWLTEPEGFSLPSKHTTLAALAVGACASPAGFGGICKRAGPLAAAVGTGTSRVCLGVHWPSDVLAGWLFAEGWLRLTEPATTAISRARADACTGAAQQTAATLGSIRAKPRIAFCGVQ